MSLPQPTEGEYFYNRLKQLGESEVTSAKETLRTLVSKWTSDQLENGKIPEISDFMELHPEWNHESHSDTIEKEIDNTSQLEFRRITKFYNQLT